MTLAVTRKISRVRIADAIPRPIRSRRRSKLPEPKREQLKVQARRVVLVAVLDRREPLSREETLDELRGLVQTVGAVVVGELTQNRGAPDAATYIGKGK